MEVTTCLLLLPAALGTFALVGLAAWAKNWWDHLPNDDRPHDDGDGPIRRSMWYVTPTRAKKFAVVTTTAACLFLGVWGSYNLFDLKDCDGEDVALFEKPVETAIMIADCDCGEK